MSCPAKHTKLQPVKQQWLCPWCQGDNEVFCIEEPAEGSDDCDLLHEQDFAYCSRCEKGCTGRSFANRLAKAANLISCPTCKGKGLVAGPKENPNG